MKRFILFMVVLVLMVVGWLSPWWLAHEHQETTTIIIEQKYVCV